VSSVRKPLALAIAGLAVTALIAVVLAMASGRPQPEPVAIAPSSSVVVVASTSPAPAALADDVPWLDAPFVEPTPEPTADPAGLPLCERDTMVLLAMGWGGATGSQAGGIRLVNVSEPCRLEQPTHVALVDADGATVATSDESGTASGALDVPPGGEAVTLTNISEKGAPIRLPEACPSYTQGLYLPDTREVKTRDLLNCDAAVTIEPGGSRTFEMRIPIPPDATPGTATLLWQLGHMGPDSPKLAIEITAP
jgi:hypothetical protein